MSKPTLALDIPSSTDNPFPDEFHNKMGQSEWRGLSDSFDLTQFGVNMEIIKPGGSSGLSHWHTDAEEFVYVLSGALTLEYGADSYVMTSGDCMGFKANEGKGHRLVNHTDSDAAFIVVGSRLKSDTAVYDKDDFKWLVTDSGEWIPAYKDGTKRDK